MAHARQGIKFDVVFGCVLAQSLLCLTAQLCHGRKSFAEHFDGMACQHQQFAHQAVSQSICFRRAAFLNFAQAVLQSFHQQLSTAWVVEQVVLQIRIALNHPNIAQHLIKHASRPARAAFVSQLIEQVPGTDTQQTNHNFSIGEACVVVGNFAQAR